MLKFQNTVLHKLSNLLILMSKFSLKLAVTLIVYQDQNSHINKRLNAIDAAPGEVYRKLINQEGVLVLVL